jgi:hypothetical protein
MSSTIKMPGAVELKFVAHVLALMFARTCQVMEEPVLVM